MIITAAVLSVVVLLLIIIKFKFQAFVGLLVATILFGFLTGMAPMDLVDQIVSSMGGALGQIALVIGLGAIFGEVLQRAGAAEQLARTLTEKVSDRYLSWTLGLAGFLVSLAVFIDVAIVILVPLLYAIARRTGRSLLYYGIPLCAGLSVTHTFIPPTPGPIATAGIIDADLGLVILYGAICGLPAMAVGGPLFGRWIAKKIHIEPPVELAGAAGSASPAGTPGVGSGSSDQSAAQPDAENPLPSFLSVLGALLLPLALILVGTTSDLLLPDGDPPRRGTGLHRPPGHRTADHRALHPVLLRHPQGPQRR